MLNFCCNTDSSYSEFDYSAIRTRYRKVRHEIPEKLKYLCEMINTTPEYRSIIVTSSIKLLDEYISLYVEREEDMRNCRLRLTIMTLACFWICAKFHDDDAPDSKDIEYTTHRDWKDIVEEEARVFQRVGFDICRFMLEDDNPLIINNNDLSLKQFSLVILK